MYLAGYALYVGLLFNYHLDKFLDFYAVVMVFFGIVLLRKDQLHSLVSTIAAFKSLKIFVGTALSLAIIFTLATLMQTSWWIGAMSLGAQYLGPFALSLVAASFFLATNNSIKIIFTFSIFAVLNMVVYEIVLYVVQWSSAGHFLEDHSHRWCSDAYIFFFPLVALSLVCINSIFIKRCVYFLIAAMFALAVGSGSRGVYLSLSFELFILLLLALHIRWIAKKQFLIILLALFLILLLAIHYLAPTLAEATLNRGLKIDDRLLSTWGPTWTFISKSPILGYGFGKNVWDAQYLLYQKGHPDAINVGNAHSWLLQVGFLGGIFSMITLCGLILGFFSQAKNIFMNAKYTSALRLFALALCLGFFGFYITHGAVETPNWKPLFLLLAWLIVASYHCLQAELRISSA